ncbi:MAG: hypothetical protein ACJ748_06785 [Flavisolibacter sp.]
MKFKTLGEYFLFIYFINLFVSCNRYIDKVSNFNNSPIKQGYFYFYPDSNVLVYKPEIILSMDREKLFPKSFKVKLPKKLKYYEITGTNDLSLYYPNNQTIFIRIDLQNNELLHDTSYFPQKQELDRIIQSKLNMQKSKFDIKSISYRQSRKQVIIKRGPATILLYNIENKNYELFFKYLNGLYFIN